LVTDPNFQQGSALSVIGPAEALAIANGFRLPLNGPGEDLLRQQLTKLEADYVRTQGQLVKTMTPEQIMIGKNNYIKQHLQRELNNIPSTGGSFSPPDLATTLTLPGITGTLLSTS